MWSWRLTQLQREKCSSGSGTSFLSLSFFQVLIKGCHFSRWRRCRLCREMLNLDMSHLCKLIKKHLLLVAHLHGSVLSLVSSGGGRSERWKKMSRETFDREELCYHTNVAAQRSRCDPCVDKFTCSHSRDKGKKTPQLTRRLVVVFCLFHIWEWNDCNPCWMWPSGDHNQQTVWFPPNRKGFQGLWSHLYVSLLIHSVSFFLLSLKNICISTDWSQIVSLSCLLLCKVAYFDSTQCDSRYTGLQGVCEEIYADCWCDAAAAWWRGCG